VQHVGVLPVFNLIGLSRPVFIHTPAMLKNFFKVAMRNLWRHKGYSFLNIFGLAMGMTCSLLILLWIRDEKSIDNFHAHGDRLYTVYELQYYDGKAE
jgi:putative ABC transport system permease protein